MYRLLRFATALACAIALGAVLACGPDAELERLDQQARQALAGWQWPRLDSIAGLMLARAKDGGSRQYEAKALYYLSTYRQGEKRERSEARYADLLRAADIAAATRDIALQSSIFNTMGAYEMGLHQRYSTAQYYFNKAAALARSAGDVRLETAASLNLSEACRVLGDTLGLAADQRLLGLAKAGGDTVAIFAAELHRALYYMEASADSSLFAECTASMRRGPRSLRWTADVLEAEWLLRRGRTAEAMAAILCADPDREAFADNVYVAVLSAAGRYAQANARIDKLLAMPAGEPDALAHDSLMTLKAANLAALGDKAGAYLWQERARQCKAKLDERKRQDQTNRFRVEYELAGKNHQIVTQRAQMRLVVIVCSGICIVLLLTIGFIIYYYRRRRELYRAVVAGRLQQPAHTPASDTPAKETAKESAGAELWQAIERRCRDGQAWRDPAITRDTLAESLGTNRTYLTDAIRANTGLSYTAYMNSLRVEAAVEVLSAPGDVNLGELSKSLGFLTINTFYTAFRQTTGMPPGAFRKTALEMKG